jgi:hypothetical protein
MMLKIARVSGSARYGQFVVFPCTQACPFPPSEETQVPLQQHSVAPQVVWLPQEHVTTRRAHGRVPPVGHGSMHALTLSPQSVPGGMVPGPTVFDGHSGLQGAEVSGGLLQAELQLLPPVEP